MSALRIRVLLYVTVASYSLLSDVTCVFSSICGDSLALLTAAVSYRPNPVCSYRPEKRLAICRTNVLLKTNEFPFAHIQCGCGHRGPHSKSHVPSAHSYTDSNTRQRDVMCMESANINVLMQWGTSFEVALPRYSLRYLFNQHGSVQAAMLPCAFATFFSDLSSSCQPLLSRPCLSRFELFLSVFWSPFTTFSHVFQNWSAS